MRRISGIEQGTSVANRRGVATLYVIVAGCALLGLLILVADIANIWLARIEYENALGAAALAAVKEWGDASGGDTLIPRRVGVAYFEGNTVSGSPLFNQLGLNYNPASGLENDNASCDGDLIFGAITTEIPPFNPPYTFDADQIPSCSLGEVLFDVTDSGPLDDPGSWGINFQDDPDLPSGLVIRQVILDLRASGVDPDAIFDISPSIPPEISDRTTADNNGKYYLFPLTSLPAQDDVFGLDNGPLAQNITPPIQRYFNSQVEFVFNTTQPWILEINFRDNNNDPNDGEIGFEPGDRIRFSAKVANVSTGTGRNDGDGIGRIETKVTVTFAINNVDQTPPSEGFFIDSAFGGKNESDLANYPPDIAPIAANLPFVIPRSINEPAGPGPNDDQSYVLIGGGSGLPFAVRAQGTVEVPSLFCSLFGMPIPNYRLTAKETAFYDCRDRCPRLIRPRFYKCGGVTVEDCPPAN